MTAWQRYQPTALLLVCLAVVSVLIHGEPVWLDTSAIIAIYALLALSVGISYGQAGILSVAQAAFASLGAYWTAILSARYDVSPYWGLVGAILFPAVIAYPLARIVTRLTPLALAITTLVFGQAVDIGLREGGNFTGGYIGISGIPPVPIAATDQAFHFLGWGAVLAVVTLYSNLVDSAYGRALNTIRSDALRATADGVDIHHMRSAVLALSAAVAGLSGWLYAHHISYLGPDSLTPSTSLSVLLMAVVGGAQTVLGPVVGAAVLTLLFKFVPAQGLQGMFYGGALIFVLLIAPRGLLGTSWRAIIRLPKLTRRNPKTTGVAEEASVVRRAP
jgi:branched-chain amino acid transport system permease protein